MNSPRRDPTGKLTDAEFLFFVHKWGTEFLEICARRKMKKVEKPLRDMICAIDATLQECNAGRLNSCALRNQGVAEAIVSRHIQKMFG